MAIRPDKGTFGLLSVESALQRATDHLVDFYQGTFSRETVERFVNESYALLERTATVKTHLVAVAEHFTLDRLRRVGIAEGIIDKDNPEVLFVCVHNAGRSQMAAGLLDYYSAGRVVVRSAGSLPAETLNPAVVQSMADFGLDISKAYPKPLTDDAVQAADVVITMGCGDACPIYPGKRYLDWDLEDPAGKTLDDVRPIRDEIAVRVKALLKEMELPAAPDPKPAQT
jgi:protein-tyrosine-phosphatase